MPDRNSYSEILDVSIIDACRAQSDSDNYRSYDDILSMPRLGPMIEPSG